MKKAYEILGRVTFAAILAIGCIIAIVATGGLFLIPLAFGLPLILGIGIGRKIRGKEA